MVLQYFVIIIIVTICYYYRYCKLSRLILIITTVIIILCAAVCLSARYIIMCTRVIVAIPFRIVHCVSAHKRGQKGRPMTSQRNTHRTPRAPRPTADYDIDNPVAEFPATPSPPSKWAYSQIVIHYHYIILNIYPG